MAASVAHGDMLSPEVEVQSYALQASTSVPSTRRLTPELGAGVAVATPSSRLRATAARRPPKRCVWISPALHTTAHAARPTNTPAVPAAHAPRRQSGPAAGGTPRSRKSSRAVATKGKGRAGVAKKASRAVATKGKSSSGVAKKASRAVATKGKSRSGVVKTTPHVVQPRASVDEKVASRRAVALSGETPSPCGTRSDVDRTPNSAGLDSVAVNLMRRLNASRPHARPTATIVGTPVASTTKLTRSARGDSAAYRGTPITKVGLGGAWKAHRDQVNQLEATVEEQRRLEEVARSRADEHQSKVGALYHRLTRALNQVAASRNEAADASARALRMQLRAERAEMAAEDMRATQVEQHTRMRAVMAASQSASDAAQSLQTRVGELVAEAAAEAEEIQALQGQYDAMEERATGAETALRDVRQRLRLATKAKEQTEVRLLRLLHEKNALQRQLQQQSRATPRLRGSGSRGATAGRGAMNGRSDAHTASRKQATTRRRTKPSAIEPMSGDERVLLCRRVRRLEATVEDRDATVAELESEVKRLLASNQALTVRFRAATAARKRIQHAWQGKP